MNGGFEQILKDLEGLGRELESVQKEMSELLVRKISNMEKLVTLASASTRETELVFEREIQRIRVRQRETGIPDLAY